LLYTHPYSHQHAPRYPIQITGKTSPSSKDARLSTSQSFQAVGSQFCSTSQKPRNITLALDRRQLRGRANTRWTAGQSLSWHNSTQYMWRRDWPRAWHLKPFDSSAWKNSITNV
ncbi:hypothetical protein RB213_010769, partial [Colletotrichum asianum]